VDGVAVWQVRNSTVEVRRGDEFSLTCVVTSLTPIDVVRVVLQRSEHSRDFRIRGVEDAETGSAAAGKDLRTAGSRTLRWTVADNYDVKEPFSSLPRYRIYYSYKDGVATSTLTYRGTRTIMFVLYNACMSPLFKGQILGPQNLEDEL